MFHKVVRIKQKRGNRKKREKSSKILKSKSLATVTNVGSITYYYLQRNFSNREIDL